jgi:selenocysteine-specific elongation factor
VDRVFTIRGSGTVVTGTLSGGTLQVGNEVEIYPTGNRARIRSLQTHRRAIEVARPVSRVAANLVGTTREDLERGDVVGRPGQWRATAVFEARIRPVRGLAHPLAGRGAYKVYAGSAERDARIRFYGTSEVTAAGGFARVRLSAPLVLDVFDRFVVREAGRRETAAGGVVLDTAPPPRPGPALDRRLAAREGAFREDLPALLVRERGAVPAADVAVLFGIAPPEIPGAVRAGGWWLSEELHRKVAKAVESELGAYHRAHPLRRGADLSLVRGAATRTLERAGGPAGGGLLEAALEDLAASGLLEREGSVVRLASHRVSLAGREEEVERLVRTVSEGGSAPPTIPELERAGFSRDVIQAAAESGSLVRVSPELVMTAELVGRAEEVLREAREGITVSAFRERLGTTRKYALPLLEYFDHRGLTRRQGDLRVLRDRR